MKIDLISGATYFPARAAGSKPRAMPQPQAAKKPDATGKFEAVLKEQLKPSEAAEIQKLFGDFKVDKNGAPLDRDARVEGRLGSIPLGKFIDIKI